MPGKAIHILCTRPVETALVSEAVAKGIQVDVKEFIQTVSISDASIKTQVNKAAEEDWVVIFTSMNAVDAVAQMLGDTKPAWKIFCMGNTTKELVVKYFGKSALMGTAADATGLANSVVASFPLENKKECIFFCGDQRRDELPEIVHTAGISLKEIIVYKTVETSTAIDKVYDAILFFSPSAVHSFFNKNKAGAATTFFAIGNTTAKAISHYSSNKIVTGNKPSKEALFKMAVATLSNLNADTHCK